MQRLLLLIFVTIPFLSYSEEMPVIFPPSLNKGDTIALVFPASYIDKGIESDHILQQKARWLQKRGYKVVFYPKKVHPKGYLAGENRQRAKALMDAWKDPQVKAIWCVRGGWGSPLMLGFLDYTWIKNHPKIFMGMSDITALHQAIIQKTNLICFLTPVLNFFHDPQGDFDDSYAFQEMEKILVYKRKGIVFYPKEIKMQVVRPGIAQGRIVGGNLTLIASLCGTPWQLDTANKILLLEDVDEYIYRLDRKLWQLKEAHLLEKPKAVILASWTNCSKGSFRNSRSFLEVIDSYFKEAPYPVILGFPSGHDKYQTTVPLNILAEVDTTKKMVRYLQSAVSVTKK